MEARAVQRHVRQSARKMRLVVDLIRGRPVPEAYAILRFCYTLNSVASFFGTATFLSRTYCGKPSLNAGKSSPRVSGDR